MNLLDVLARFFGVARQASDADEADARRLEAARAAGRTAGQIASEAEAEARRLHARTGPRCRVCGGTGFLRAHVDEPGAPCPRCGGSGDEPGGRFSGGPPPAVPVLIVALMLPAQLAAAAPPGLASVPPPLPQPPPIYCERMLAEPDPQDAAGLQRVLVCERLTSGYRLGLDALALHRAEETAAALRDPPSRLQWLLVGAGLAVLTFGAFETYQEVNRK